MFFSTVMVMAVKGGLSTCKKNGQQLDKSHCPFREENETNSKMDTGMLETFKLG